MNKLYSTQDFYLSIVFVALGKNLESIEVEPLSKKATFQFTVSDELLHIVELYWKREVNIEAQSLFQAHRYLKNRLNERLRGNDIK